MIGIEQAFEAPGAEYADVETGAENCSETLQSKEWEVNFSKNMDIALFQIQSTWRYYSAYFYEVMINHFSNFIACFYFPLAFIRWNSSNCQLTELFKCKESFKRKVDSDNNWKAV